jgi:two-component system sensor histidine kinase EvgS
MKAKFRAERTAVIIAVVLCALFLRFPIPIHAAGPEKRTVRVGYFTLANFQEYDASDQSYRGYGYDYLMAVAQYAGWNCKLVPVSYDEGLKMLQNGQLDLMNYIYPDRGTESLSLSSLAAGESWTSLVVPTNNTSVSYEDYSAIADLTVGLNYSSQMNSAFVDYCKDNDCMPRLIYYHSDEEVENALQTGEVTARLASSISDPGMRTVAKFAVSSYYFATTRGNTDLLAELNSAMNKLKVDDPYFQERLYSKYHSQSTEQQTIISDEEKAYIQDHGPVTVSYISDWIPVSYEDRSGEFTGAMRMLFDQITKRTGLQFTYQQTSSEQDAMQDFSSGRAELMAGFPYDYAWAQKNNANVSFPLFSVNLQEVTRNGDSSVAAVPQNSYQEFFSRELQGTSYTYYRYKDMTSCLQAVQNGTAGCMLADSLQTAYYQKLASCRGLSYQKIPGADFQLSIAVSRSADPMLLSILNKSVYSIGSTNIDGIFKQAANDAQSSALIDQLYSDSGFAGWFFSLLGFVIAVVFSMFIYSRRIRMKNRVIEETSAAKGQFLSNMSHDMRTPLNGIMGYTRLALKENDKEAARSYMSKVLISADFLLSLINDTLDISKIESGKYVLQQEKVNPEELLQSIVVPIQSVADSKGVRFIVDDSKMYRGPILADSLNLKKIILNLLSNAVKFTPKGGTVELKIAQIDPVSGCNCRIVVKDSGIGMSKDFQEKMFEPFTQESSSLSKGTVGTGLGLSIVKRIVTLMNGTIHVQSEPGRGSTFEVLLPIVSSAETDIKPDHRSEDDTRLQGRSILLCEDNEMNREIATAILSDFGIRVTEAENGKLGTELFRSASLWKYDLVLMDLRMPVMNGLEAAKIIRAMPRADAGCIPIVAMTADAYSDDIRRCRDAGMNAHITKPIDNDTLKQELLRQFRMEDAVREGSGTASGGQNTSEENDGVQS